MKRFFTFIIIIASVLLLFSGCNTFRGLGEDIERMGESMQDAGQ